MDQKEGGERACFRARAPGSACLAVRIDLAIGITILVHPKGIVQSGLDSINRPYTVLTSVVEMKPTC